MTLPGGVTPIMPLTRLLEIDAAAFLAAMDDGATLPRFGARVSRDADWLRGAMVQTVAFEGKVRRDSPWGSYLVIDDALREVVGVCGYKSAPTTEGMIEVAYGGLLIEAGLKPVDQYRSSEAVLANPEIAHHLTVDSVVYDPSGLLRNLQEPVRRAFAYPQWIAARLDHERRGIAAAFDRLLGDMVETMYDEVGIGLAATQVGIELRMLVVDEGRGVARAYLNPVIVERGGEAVGEEGCLSLPGIFADVTRAAWVVVEARERDGTAFRKRASGLLARVLQHEMDHLDGVLFIDRLSLTGRLSAKETLHEFEINFEGQRQRQEIPDDAAIALRLAELERLRC